MDNLPFRSNEDRKKELELRKDVLVKYFPDWPIHILIENRIDDLKSKDHGMVRCVGRKSFRSGYIYQFELYRDWKHLPYQGAQPACLGGGSFSIIGGDGPNEDGYWTTKGFFRGLEPYLDAKCRRLDTIAFIEIPDPDTWLEESHSDRFTKKRPGNRKSHREYRYTLIKVKSFLGDLEFATLVSKYDFVVSETDGFYHDMMIHTGKYIKWDMHKEAKQSLGPYLEHYQNYHPKTALMEFILGYAADTCTCLSKFSDEEFGHISAIKKISFILVRDTWKHFLTSYDRGNP